MGKKAGTDGSRSERMVSVLHQEVTTDSTGETFEKRLEGGEGVTK